MNLESYLGKLRPQIFVSLVGLILIAILSIRSGQTEIGVGCIAGVIALSKDVLQSDA
jgi:hypothetical protein